MLSLASCLTTTEDPEQSYRAKGSVVMSCLLRTGTHHAAKMLTPCCPDLTTVILTVANKLLGLC